MTELVIGKLVGSGSDYMNVEKFLRLSKMTSLVYWFPLLKNIAVAQPRTEWILVDRGAMRDLVVPPTDWKDLSPELRRVVMKSIAISGRIGFPLFLRSDLTSGKHDWKDTCFVEKPEHLYHHLSQMVLANEDAGMVGVPYTALVFREFLELEWKFKAFQGQMPVAKERRYFVQDGEILCHHPYWPPKAIWGAEIDEERVADELWRPLLDDLNFESSSEIHQLSAYAREISEILSGYWSIDFAQGQNGQWYFLDAAMGYISYHWKDCPHQLKGE